MHKLLHCVPDSSHTHDDTWRFDCSYKCGLTFVFASEVDC